MLLPFAYRLHFITLAMCGIWFCTTLASARTFSVQTISNPADNSRNPSIGETGLVAWQTYLKNENGDAGSHRSVIFMYRNGKMEDVTGGDPRFLRSERPIVFRDSIAFMAWYRNESTGGFPFQLELPQKTERMLKMESEYSDLFDPPLAAPVSAIEADAALQDTTNQLPEESQPLPEVVDINPTNALQYQNWRGSGKGGDVTIYYPNDGVKRITPGNRHYNFPVVSEAGAAFLCARGWPYGYDMVVWKTGDDKLIQVTANYFYVLNPNIHGNELVFQGWDGDDYEIYRYRFDSGQLEQITNNQFDDISPVVWNGEIAWVAHPTITAEIFHWRDGMIRKISEGSSDNGNPSIWEGKVTWQGYDETDIEIYYFNGRRTIKLTSNTWDDIFPKFDAGLIVWMSYVDNWDSEIMAIDLGDNIAVQITENDLEDVFPQTAGEKIVWQTLAPDSSTIQMATPTEKRAGEIN